MIKTLFKILLVVAIALSAVALFLGTKTEKAEPKEKPAAKQAAQQDYEYEQTDSPIETEGDSLEVTISKEDFAASEKVAMDFIKAYHNFDASQPLQNIENSKKFMSNNLYESNIKNPSRGTLDAVKKKWIKVEVTETIPTSTDKIVWDVVVQSENINNDGEKNNSEDGYLIDLKKENGQYKVMDVISYGTN